MRPPDTVGRCQACPLQAPTWDGLCIRCWSRCTFCGGEGRVFIVYPRTPAGFMERRCQACDGSGRKPWAA